MRKEVAFRLCLQSYLEGLEPSYLVLDFIYSHTLCMRAAKALVIVCICEGLSELSLLDHAISTEFS